MRRTAQGGRRTGERGFSTLLAVAVITLFAALTALSIETSDRAARQIRIAEPEIDRRSLVELAAHTIATTDRDQLGASGPVTQSQPNGRPITLTIRDVGGLVDVNTARTDLLDATLRQDHPALLNVLTSRRRTGARIEDLDHLFAEAKTPPDDQAALRKILTTRSGRRGIDPAQAPKDLLDRLSAAQDLPDEFIDRATGRVFIVSTQTPDTGATETHTLRMTFGRRYQARPLQTR